MSGDVRLPSDIWQKVLGRSWVDPEFRDLVLKDPRAALQQLGYEVPEGLTINVVTQPGHALTLAVAQHPSGVATTPGVTAGAGDGEFTQAGSGSGYICTITRECGCTQDIGPLKCSG